MIVALAVGLALGIQALVVKPFQIPTPSMVPTLEPGQKILVNRLVYRFGSPDIGDVVVFHPPAGADNGGQRCGDPTKAVDEPCSQPTEEASDDNFVKRVVAGPGDRLRIEDGHPVVNGEPMDDEPYIKPCPVPGGECDLEQEITIPPEHYFMMGDNRGSSLDSRFWGPVPEDWIIGQAFFTYWPLDRLGTL